MNLFDLRVELEKAGYTITRYIDNTILTGESSFGGSLAIKKLRDMWQIYATDGKNVIQYSKLFDTEDQACRFFWARYKLANGLTSLKPRYFAYWWD